MQFVWNVSPEIVTLGPLTLRWYGVLFATGFVLASKITAKMFIREKQNLASLDTLVGYMIAGTLVGARLGHTLIYEPEIYLADPIRILKIWEGGLASHGGTLGAMLAAWIWNRRFRSKGTYLSLLDWLSFPTALVCTMIRLGNLFNSEILGKPTGSSAGVVFARVDQLPRHPAMVYEALCYFVIFWILRVMWNRKVNQREGVMFGLFISALFGSRFLIEFVKEVQVDSELGLALHYGQWLSLPFVVAGLFLIFRAQKKAR
jgi:phosphatidylglycerol:prolipoprotein diacylglycerol transferase